jgi:uncharacterized membrane protein (UPF0127 family)
VHKLSAAYLSLLILTIATAAVVALYFNDAPVASGRRLVMPNSAKAYTLLLADTEAERKRGLGDRKSLSQNEGMLFVDEQQGRQCFWMKDMRFAIDIIWVDNDKRITAIERNLDPSSYPQTYCAEGQYVIELNAGEAGKNNLKAGQRLFF